MNINVSLSARTSSWSIESPSGLVVGTVHSAASLRAALALDPLPAAPDLLELRLDHFAPVPQVLEALAAQSPRALIVTVRDAAEGGQGNLDSRSRARLYEQFLPEAHYVDLELSSLAGLASIAEQARGTRGGLIASYHDFRGGPNLAPLRNLAERAVDAGAAVLKVAVQVEQPRHVAALLEFLATETRLPLAVMGMGRLGRITRLAAGALGSRLNYGYLGDAAQVPGQWPAAVLRVRLDELSQNPPPAEGAAISDKRNDPKWPGQRTDS